jgi:ABC-type nitrate/sulfonate/bicarbonate transport system ATPase subunit
VELAVEHLNFGYPGVPLFDDFDFSCAASRIMVRGPSGCGKTTLLKLVAGVQAAPQGARIVAAEPLFIVLQNDGLVPWLSGRRNFQLFSEDLWERVLASELFAMIAPFVERRACDMSHGQRRSVELVRALLSDKALLLLDEPLNFLDRDRRESFLAYMRDDRRCRSQILMTSHYEDSAVFGSGAAFEFTGEAPFRRLTEVAHANG